MSLFKQIKAEQLEARKTKDTVKASLLTTLIGEIQTSVTGGASASQFGILNPTDDETTKVIKKFIKNAETSLSMRQDDKTQEELNIAREQWINQDERFGSIPDYDGPRLEAPAFPDKMRPSR